MVAKSNEPVLAEFVERPANRSGLLLVFGLIGAASVVLFLFLLFVAMIAVAALVASRPMPQEVAETDPAVLQVTDETFDAEVLNAGTFDPILVDFHADWCGPCRTQAKVLQRFAAQSPNVKIAKVDVDENRMLSQRYEIESIPTLIVVKNGQITARHTGLASERELADLVRQ